MGFKPTKKYIAVSLLFIFAIIGMISSVVSSSLNMFLKNKYECEVASRVVAIQRHNKSKLPNGDELAYSIKVYDVEDDSAKCEIVAEIYDEKRNVVFKSEIFHEWQFSELNGKTVFGTRTRVHGEEDNNERDNGRCEVVYNPDSGKKYLLLTVKFSLENQEIKKYYFFALEQNRLAAPPRAMSEEERELLARRK